MSSDQALPSRRMLDVYPCEAVSVEIFSPTECAEIVHLAQTCQSEDAQVSLKEPEVAALIRSARISWVRHQQNSEWIFKRISNTIARINAKRWCYNLHSLHSLQFTKYELGDHFQWHTDVGSGPESLRKLSFSIQLTDGRCYLGGNLQFRSVKTTRASRVLGMATIFPSFLLHRVTPVWYGVRLSLVGWAQGFEPLR